MTKQTNTQKFDLLATIYDLEDSMPCIVGADGVWRITPGEAILRSVFMYCADYEYYLQDRKWYGSTVERFFN